jgi:hypothetical protein
MLIHYERAILCRATIFTLRMFDCTFTQQLCLSVARYLYCSFELLKKMLIHYERAILCRATIFTRRMFDCTFTQQLCLSVASFPLRPLARAPLAHLPHAHTHLVACWCIWCMVHGAMALLFRSLDPAIHLTITQLSNVRILTPFHKRCLCLTTL